MTGLPGIFNSRRLGYNYLQMGHYSDDGLFSLAKVTL